MCLVALALGQHPQWPLLLAANRDEFFARPAAPLALWPHPEAAGIVAGRDLREGGAWLGLSALGRLAVLTNVREPMFERPRPRSRGEWVARWLSGTLSVDELVQGVSAEDHGGFNLIVVQWAAQERGLPNAGASSEGLVGAWRAHWVSNRLAPGVPGWMVKPLGPGVYGLSNASLDSPWPKTRRLRERVAQSLAGWRGATTPRGASTDSDPVSDPVSGPVNDPVSGPREGLHGALFEALQHRVPAPDEDLPQTGLPLLAERSLSSAFIDWPDHPNGPYGTRCSTVVSAQWVDGGLELLAEERTHGPAPAAQSQPNSRAVLNWPRAGFQTTRP